jgi:hypothetical protein
LMRTGTKRQPLCRESFQHPNRVTKNGRRPVEISLRR